MYTHRAMPLNRHNEQTGHMNDEFITDMSTVQTQILSGHCQFHGKFSIDQFHPPLPPCHTQPPLRRCHCGGGGGGGGGGGFFLACEDLGRMFNHSFPACDFFFF